MTELRQKMIRAMELKNLSPHTRRAYLAAVTGLARHYRQSPAAISKEMIEDYLLSLNGTQPAVQHPDLFACQPRNARQGPQPALLEMKRIPGEFA
jgi:hypothetical protein